MNGRLASCESVTNRDTSSVASVRASAHIRFISLIVVSIPRCRWSCHSPRMERLIRENCCIWWPFCGMGVRKGIGDTEVHQIVNQGDGGTVNPHSLQGGEVPGYRSLADASQCCIFLCTKRVKTIWKRTSRLNCEARRFAARHRSLGRIDGYFRRLQPVVPGVFSVRDCGMDQMTF